jgi:TRAP-type C4-dicarboxylate transport system permease small subunit
MVAQTHLNIMSLVIFAFPQSQWLLKSTSTLCFLYFLFFHSHNGCSNAPQHYVSCIFASPQPQWLLKRTSTLCFFYFLFLHSHNGCSNAPQHYVSYTFCFSTTKMVAQTHLNIMSLVLFVSPQPQWLLKCTSTLCLLYFLFLHSHNGCSNAPQHYVSCTFTSLIEPCPVLYINPLRSYSPHKYGAQ